MYKSNGALVISLDFELLWGVFDKVNYKTKISYFHNTRKVIPEILRLFENYEIHSTWAIVGMLFNENWEEWASNYPYALPLYNKRELNAFKYGELIRSKETEDFCFAPQLIRQIKNAKNQEIGTHTYSHYYCLEGGQNISSFRADMEKSLELARNFGIEIKSLIFPRNQFNSSYLKTCFDLGIENVRVNPSNWYWKSTQKNQLAQKIFRTGDAYGGVLDKSYNYAAIQYNSNEVVSQKASRLLRPYSNNFLNRLKINRIKAEMTNAAKENKVYHLWWHPHNFGDNPTQNLRDLSEILLHFNFCKEKYGFQSLTMGEINSLIKDGR